MNATMTELAFAIAKSGEWKPRVGTTVLDPSTGIRFLVVHAGRKTACLILACPPIQQFRDLDDLDEEPLTLNNATSLYDAIGGAIPDLDDEATWRTLAADILEIDHSLTVDRERLQRLLAERRAFTHPEAVARAWLWSRGKGLQ